MNELKNQDPELHSSTQIALDFIQTLTGQGRPKQTMISGGSIYGG